MAPSLDREQRVTYDLDNGGGLGSTDREHDIIVPGMLRPPLNRRCVFIALISAWAVAVFLPSALIAVTGISPLAAGHGMLAGTWRVADETAPFAKIGYAAAFLVLLLLTRRAEIDRRWDVSVDVVLALISMLLVLAFLPRTWSRGFGIGLTGTRFSTAATIIYFLGAAVSGVTFAVTQARCTKRSA